MKIHHISFLHAWDGIKYAFTNHPNFKVHLLLGTLALVTASILKVTQVELIILIVLFVIGLVVEMINTAIESVVDLVTQEWRQHAKIAKDVSAGAMLVYAFGASLISAIILFPKLF